MIKRLLAGIAVFFLCVASYAQTWTIHVVKENATYVGVYGDIFYVPGPGCAVGYFSTFRSFACMDYYYDAAYPEYAYSGIQEDRFQTNGCGYSTTTYPGYTDTIILTATNTVTLANTCISQGYPDYNNEQCADLPLSGGEFWIDFSPLGMVRVSNSPPSDFGKWLWDGSINPNYIEPLSPIWNKRGKGHRK